MTMLHCVFDINSQGGGSKTPISSPDNESPGLQFRHLVVRDERFRNARCPTVHGGCMNQLQDHGILSVDGKQLVLKPRYFKREGKGTISKQRRVEEYKTLWESFCGAT